MPKRLEEGKTRKMKKSPQFTGYSLDFEVIAECVDWDTPIVHLSITGNDGETAIVSLGDFEVDELIMQLKRALSILPTSK